LQVVAPYSEQSVYFTLLHQKDIWGPKRDGPGFPLAPLERLAVLEVLTCL